MANVTKKQTIPMHLVWCKGCDSDVGHFANWVLTINGCNGKMEIGVCDEYVKKNNIKTKNNINIRRLRPS